MVATILGEATLKAQWVAELDAMRTRVADLRRGLVDALQPYGLAERFAHIGEQRGMFSYTGLTPEQVARLRAEFSVYMVGTGRANVAGLDFSRIGDLAKAIAAVC
ncbi:Tyrosine aminotransferase [compost metagenome]